MAVTLQNLRDIFYDILRENEDTSAYPLTFVDSLINGAIQSICSGRLVNPVPINSDLREVRKGNLPFLNTEVYYTNHGATGLTSATASGDTTLNVTDTSNFLDSGALYVNGNIVTYTGKTSSTFTGCSGVIYSHTPGVSVYPIFVLPTNYSRAINVIYNEKIKLPGKKYDDVYEDINDYKGSNYARNRADGYYDSPYKIKPFYTIKDASYLLIWNLHDNSYPVRLRYEKKPTELSASTDEVIIDNDIYAKNTVPFIAVGDILYHRGEEGRASEVLNYGISKVREMYDYYNNSTFEDLNGVTYKVGKGKLNI